MRVCPSLTIVAPVLTAQRVVRWSLVRGSACASSLAAGQWDFVFVFMQAAAATAARSECACLPGTVETLRSEFSTAWLPSTEPHSPPPPERRHAVLRPCHVNTHSTQIRPQSNGAQRTYMLQVSALHTRTYLHACGLHNASMWGASKTDPRLHCIHKLGKLLQYWLDCLPSLL